MPHGISFSSRSYKLTHWGQAPFKSVDSDTDLVDMMKGKKLEKRQLLAGFLFFFFSVLIVFVALEIFLRVLTAAIWLAVFMPFTFLAIVLFVFLIV